MPGSLLVLHDFKSPNLKYSVSNRTSGMAGLARAGRRPAADRPALTLVPVTFDVVLESLPSDVIQC